MDGVGPDPFYLTLAVHVLFLPRRNYLDYVDWFGLHTLEDSGNQSNRASRLSFAFSPYRCPGQSWGLVISFQEL